VELKETPGTTGNGLTASLLSADGKVVEQWLSPQATFDAARDLQTPAAQALAKKGPFGVRFFGRIEAPTDGDYPFTVKAAGRVRLLIDGRIALDTSLNEEMKGLALNPFPLKAKQRRWIQLEYWPQPGKPAQVSLQWTRPGLVAEAVPPTALFATPNPYALPFGEGVGLSADYFKHLIPLETLTDPNADRVLPEIERIDPEINTAVREYSIVWDGYFQPRSTGWTRLRPGPSAGFVMRMKIEDRLAAEHYLFLEAGKKYPITVYARSWSDIANTTFQFRLETSRWTAPHTTEENMTLIPQSQLFPENHVP